MVAPVFAVIDACAKMLPTKVVFVPRVVDDPTCQKTLHAWAPPVSSTELLEPVISVVPAWKMNTELAPPLRVSGNGPLSAMLVEAV